MTADASGSPGVRDTVALLWRPLVAALWSGRPDPAPPLDRPWPFWLRWTRAIRIGRLPFGAVVQVFDLGITLAVLFGTWSVLRNAAVNYRQALLDNAVRPGLPTDVPGPQTLLLIAVAVAVPLAVRQGHPLGAWRMIALATLLFDPRPPLFTPYTPGGTIVAMLCLYQVAARCPRDVTVGVGMVSVAGVLVIDRAMAAGAIALLLLPLLAGYLVRQRQVARRELAEQEERHREAEAVLTERQRIARELHDVVAHHMSMIAIQAEAAPYKVTGLPDETRRDLSEIRSTALDALTEMRRILGVLRSENGAETAPQPGLDRLDELVSNARSAGLHVTEHLDGDLAGLPQGVGLTAYRILQEALSNAMRHAPGSHVTLAAERRDDDVRLHVVNGPPADGQRPTPSPPGGGHGLTGMRERAAMLGGSLTAAPGPEGGFTVTAVLPVKERAS
ncbi:sensor histidine kinase [Actinomadura kijaniata]|uniref:sensor histidine kinase n=1 Tax=Actinomadura kijaniata TaxID=46161 RepID=UPI000AF30785|nr:sensor histidine kinase [Actinomadura kijaniata]